MPKPKGIGYPAKILTIGDHLRSKRLDKGQLQKEVAEEIGVSEDCITNWENNRNTPQIQHYPKIIQFLGYYPFEKDKKTIGGRIKMYRHLNGLSYKALGKILGCDGTTIGDWECNKRKPNLKSLEVIVLLLEANKPFNKPVF